MRVRIDTLLRSGRAQPLLVIYGRGFDKTDTQLDFDPGLGAGLRVSVPLGKFAPFVGGGFAAWLRPQQARAVDVPAPPLSLPRVELLLHAGAAFGNWTNLR